MARQQDDDNDGLNPLLIFAVISAIFVVVIMIIFIVVIVIGASAVTSSSKINGPYDVLSRPLPKVSSATALLPKQLGSFQRGTLNGTLDDYQTTYKSGDYQIDISGSQAISVALAQAYVNKAMQAENTASIVLRQLNPDPSYYITSGKGPVHYVWSHYIWFFNVKANSQAALDEFMKVFKY